MSKKPDLSELSKKEKKEFLKELRKEERKKASLRSNFIKVIVILIVLAVVGGVGYLIVTSGPQTPRPELGEVISIQGQNHISPGDSHEPYNSNPPSSGPHLAQLAQCKIYDTEVRDEAAVHSLEHGAVWVTYKNKDDAELVKKLEDLVKTQSGKILLSPRAANDSTIALASWGRIMKLENFDEVKIKDYIKSFRNSGPEFAPC